MIDAEDLCLCPGRIGERAEDVEYCPAPQFLPRRREPGLGALPGVVGAVELVGAEGPVAVGQDEAGSAPAGARVREGSQRQAAVIAVRREAGGKVARKRELLADAAPRRGRLAALLVDAEVPHRSPQPELGGFRRFRDQVHHAAHRVRAIVGRAGALQHLDSIQGVHGERDVEIVMAGLRVVHAQAIHEHQRLAKGSTADGEIGRNAVGRTRLQVERRVQPQEVHHRRRQKLFVGAQRQNADRAVGFPQRHGFVGAGHQHDLVPLHAQHEPEKPGRHVLPWYRFAGGARAAGNAIIRLCPTGPDVSC